MATSAIATSLSALSSALKATGVFEAVVSAEPKSSPPTKGMSVALFLASIGPGEITLSQASAVYTFTVRIFLNALGQSPEALELAIAAGVDTIMDKLAEDFTLGDSIRAPDFGGIFGTQVGGETGYIEVNGNMFRVFDLTVPLIVNDAWSAFVA